MSLEDNLTRSIHSNEYNLLNVTNDAWQRGLQWMATPQITMYHTIDRFLMKLQRERLKTPLFAILSYKITICRKLLNEVKNRIRMNNE